jgi:hypothetical protein
MTGWDTPREVWLPSPDYKYLSRFWDLIYKQIKHLFPFDVSSLSEEEIVNIVSERFETCKTLDIKGFGLAFPRSMIIAVINRIKKSYPLLSEQAEKSISIIQNIEVEIGNQVVKPKRGVGLGYFHPLMYLITFCLLRDSKVVASFADDSLIKAKHFNKCAERFKHYTIPINEKKSQIKWKNIAFFIQSGIVPGEDHLYKLSNKNSLLAGIFNQRFHWERKFVCSMLPAEEQIPAAFCLERIFGKEFFRGEAMSNVKDGGYLDCIPQNWGVSRSKYACDTSSNKTRIMWRLDILPEELLLEERKDIHQERKRRWRSKKTSRV